MSTLSILRNTLKLNADVITMLQFAVVEAKSEGKTKKSQGNPSYTYAYDDARKHSIKLAKAVEMQKRVKLEIAHIFRVARIQRKFLKVFGQLPVQALTTTREQEAMLDRLLADRAEEAKQPVRRTNPGLGAPKPAGYNPVA